MMKRILDMKGLPGWSSNSANCPTCSADSKNEPIRLSLVGPRMRRATRRHTILLSTTSLSVSLFAGCAAPVEETTQCTTYYQDADGDGTGGTTSTEVCDGQMPAGYSSKTGDCRDDSAAIGPHVRELCDLIDNNCDSRIDESGNTYFQDADRDGIGGTITASGCVAPEGYVLQSGDCVDNDAKLFPGGPEACDGADSNCDGIVPDDEQDLGNGQFLCQAFLDLKENLTTLTIEQGDIKNISFPVDLRVDVPGDFTVTFDHSISPYDDVMSNESRFAFPLNYTYSRDVTGIVNVSIHTAGYDAMGQRTVTPPGTYDIQFTANTSNGASAFTLLQVEVVEPGSLKEKLTVYQLRSYPSVLPASDDPDEKSDVTFRVRAKGPVERPDHFILEESINNVWEYVGEMYDSGDDDEIVGDGTYTATFSVHNGTDEGARWFRAVVEDDGETIVTDRKPLFTTWMPVDPFPVDLSEANLSSNRNEFGSTLVCNRLAISMQDGVTPGEAEEVLEGLNGATIVGYLPHLGNVYQVELANPNCTAESAKALADQIQASSDKVSQVELEALTTTDSVTGFPTDPLFFDSSGTGNDQDNMRIVRADEAWLIGAGTVKIGDVDTGADFTHADLNGKLINGKDFVKGDNDSTDIDGHGTHTAGILGAVSNNGLGVSGVAWNSQVLVTRGLGGTISQMAQAIQYASDQGADVISISGGSDSNQSVLSNACTYASTAGNILFASAGATSPSGSSTPRYPAYYSTVQGITSTTNSGVRSTTARYGDWVWAAAPGETVISTYLGNTYALKTGTSQSSALAAGGAALIWSMNPSFTVQQLKDRLYKTGRPIDPGTNPVKKVGGGNLDFFEAGFHGSFEMGDMTEWTSTGTCSVVSSLGSITTQTDADYDTTNYFAYCTTGLADADDGIDFSELVNNVTFTTAVSNVPVSFYFNLITEECPEWVGNFYNDSFTVKMVNGNGTEVELYTRDINDLGYPDEDGDGISDLLVDVAVDFPDGDDTTCETGWLQASGVISTVSGSGSWSLLVEDIGGDSLYDTALAIDNVSFNSTPKL